MQIAVRDSQPTRSYGLFPFLPVDKLFRTVLCFVSLFIVNWNNTVTMSFPPCKLNYGPPPLQQISTQLF